MGYRGGVPHLRGSGWGASGVSGVSWVNGFGGRVCVRGVRHFVSGGGGFGLLLARPPGLFLVPLGLLEGGEEVGPGDLAEDGAARVFHPNGTVLPPMDTTDAAPLYPGGVGYVDDRPNDRILGTVVLLLGTLGGVGPGGGGCGGGLGGVGGAGGGDGLRRPCGGGGGGGGFLGRGIAPLSLSSDDSKENFRFLGAGWGGLGCGLAWGGGVWGGGGGRPPPPPPRSPHTLPCSPLCSSSAPRIPQVLHPSPLPGPDMARRHPDAANHTRSLPVPETAQESEAPGWIPGHDAVEGPQGYFLGALGVSPGHPNGPGIRRIDHDVDNLQKKKQGWRAGGYGWP